VLKKMVAPAWTPPPKNVSSQATASAADNGLAPVAELPELRENEAQTGARTEALRRFLRRMMRAVHNQFLHGTTSRPAFETINDLLESALDECDRPNSNPFAKVWAGIDRALAPSSLERISQKYFVNSMVLHSSVELQLQLLTTFVFTLEQVSSKLSVFGVTLGSVQTNNLSSVHVEASKTLDRFLNGFTSTTRFVQTRQAIASVLHKQVTLLEECCKQGLLEEGEMHNIEHHIEFTLHYLTLATSRQGLPFNEHD
jgi:hypothetical protein